MSAPNKFESYLKLGEILWPYSEPILKKVPFQRNWKGLDLGCGGGHVSTQLSRIFDLKMKGIDQDEELIQAARNSSNQADSPPIEFEVSDINRIDDFSSYHFIYGRLILNRLESPGQLVSKILDQLSADSWIVLEDLDSSSYEVRPKCEAFEQLMELYLDYERSEKRSPTIGLELEELLKKEKLEILHSSSVIPTFSGKEDGKMLMAGLFKALAPALAKLGSVSLTEIDHWVEEFTQFSRNPESTTSLNRIVQVIARKV